MRIPSRSSPDTRQARRRRGERGAIGSVQLVVLMPLLMAFFLAAVQAAMFYYGRTAAISIAQTGAAAAAAEHGSLAACRQAAADLQAKLGDALTEVKISCSRTATRATATVTGQPLNVLPGWHSVIVQRAEAPVERLT
jgi:hypothetical protein